VIDCATERAAKDAMAGAPRIYLNEVVIRGSRKYLTFMDLIASWASSTLLMAMYSVTWGKSNWLTISSFCRSSETFIETNAIDVDVWFQQSHASGFIKCFPSGGKQEILPSRGSTLSPQTPNHQT
jgi:hypothetical protein